MGAKEFHAGLHDTFVHHVLNGLDGSLEKKVEAINLLIVESAVANKRMHKAFHDSRDRLYLWLICLHLFHQLNKHDVLRLDAIVV